MFAPLVFCFHLLFSGADADASSLTYTFGGTITEADPSTGVAPGTRFTGSVTYDPDKPNDITGGDYQRGYAFGQTYSTPDSPKDESGLTIQAAGKTVYSVTGGLNMGIIRTTPLPAWYNIPNPNNTYLGMGNQTIPHGKESIYANVVLENPNLWVLPSMLPPKLLDFSQFGTGHISIYASPNVAGGPLYYGSIDTFAVNTPEPTSIALMGLGCAAWLVRSRRCRVRRAV